MLSMPHLSAMLWNPLNELQQTTRGTTDTYFNYSGGERIRKVAEKTGGIKEERIYLGSYEIYRKFVSGSLTIERTTVHVSDDTGRIAMLEVRTVGSDSAPASLQRYSYSNHLQSASLELDENADIISYEEYHPFGTTAYQASNTSINAVAKRYRYTGKERDEETGLYYHGARYYIPWLARWSASDPKQSEMPTWSSYNYGFCNPIIWQDSTGMEPDGNGELIAKTEKKKDGGWYEDKAGKAHFLDGVKFQDQFDKTIGSDGKPLEGKFFGIIEGEYNADGTHTKPHYTTSGGGAANNKVEKSVPKAVETPATAPQKPTTQAPHSGSMLEKALDIAIDFTPIVGSGRDLYKGIKSGDALLIALGTGGLLLDAVTFGGGSLIKGGIKAAFKTLTKEGAEVVAKQSVKKEIIHLDANALIGAIENGMTQNVDNLLIDKIPSVSRQAVREFLVKGDKNLLRSFLTERGGRLAKSGSEAQINSLLQFTSKTGRKVGLGDAKVAASALRENAALITNDKRFYRFLNEVGIRNFQF